jgi:predicted membrane chloride channel (bestrophin family)
MTVTTFIDRAKRRVEDEQDAVRAKRAAFDRFSDRVSSLPTTPAASAGGMTATVGTQLGSDQAVDDQCRAVRNAFAETVRPHSCDSDSEPLLETIKAEFTEQIAVALASTTETGFSNQLKTAIITEVENRKAETAALSRALDTEAAHLETAFQTVEEITDWLVAENRTPLVDLGFETLRDRHETLAAHRSRCARISREPMPAWW